MARAYTLEEVETMRSAVMGLRAANSPIAAHYSSSRSINHGLEDELRTYLTAGVEPSELVDIAAKRGREHADAMERLVWGPMRQKEAAP